jgi:transposase
MLKTTKSQKSSNQNKTLLYLAIEEKILSRTVPLLKKSGMTTREIASELKVGVKQVERLIQQADAKEAAKLRPKKSRRKMVSPDGLTWNQRQTQLARDRIQQAVADLREKGDWPDKATARFNQLVKYKISGTTLYKHRDLWDPECVQASTGLQVAQ